MIKALIRTAVLVVLVVVLAQFIPLVAQYEWPLVIVAVALGLIGIISRIIIVLLVLAAIVFFFHPFF